MASLHLLLHSQCSSLPQDVPNTKIHLKYGIFLLSSPSLILTHWYTTAPQRAAGRLSPQVEPIVAPAAVTLGHLKDQYYHDLRCTLAPSPPSAVHRKIEGWSADEKLREMRDAIDEIDRALDGANLSLFDRSCCCPAGNADHGCCDGGTATAARDTTLPGCARSAPFSDRRPKPRTGVGMKSYRLKSNDDRVWSTFSDLSLFIRYSSWSVQLVKSRIAFEVSWNIISHYQNVNVGGMSTIHIN